MSKMNNGRKQDRQKEAVNRQICRDKLTNTQQIDKLDDLFGKGKGAKKERARLEKVIPKKNKKKDKNNVTR